MKYHHWKGVLESGLPNFSAPESDAVKKATNSSADAVRAVFELEGAEHDDVDGVGKEVEDASYGLVGIVEDFQSEFKVATVEIEDLIALSADLLSLLGAIVVPTDKIEEIKEWCGDTLSGDHEFLSYNRIHMLWIKEDLDRVQFKLRWSDEIEVDFNS